MKHYISKTTFQWLTIVGVLILVVNLSLAQNKGTITGMVTEISSGKGLPGVNVQVTGTLLGASTDTEGRFVIQWVPPGTYTLRATMISHRTAQVAGVKVIAGDTTKVWLQLEETVIDFDPVIVTASKMRQELENAPTSVSVVSATEIRTRNALRIDRALESVPGVNFLHEQVNIRGSTGFSYGAANRTLLLVDGVPVMASDTGEFNWDILPILDVEQIEVVKGAGSALWGTSAMGGVINIITKSPTEQGKTLFRITTGAYDQPYYEEWVWTNRLLHFTRADLSYNRKFGPLGLRVSVGQYASTGYTQVGDFRRLNASTKLDYRFGDSSKLVCYGSWSQDQRGIFIEWWNRDHPFQVHPANLQNRARISMINLYSQYFRPVSSRLALKLRVSYLRTLMGNQFQQTGDFNPAHGLGAELQGDWMPHPSHSITFGTELKLDTGNSKYFQGNRRGYIIGFYSQDEWRLRDNLRFTCGLRYDRYQLIHGMAESLLSPRIGVNYKPFRGTTLRASAGSGFRAATIVERFLKFDASGFYVTPNPNLKAETSWSFDVGFRQYLTSNWFFDASIFDNESWNLIEAGLYASGMVQFRNVTRARVRGIELVTNGSWWHDRLGLQANCTLMEPRDLKKREPLAYRPKALAHITPFLRLGPVELQADYRYASRLEKVKVYPLDERVSQKVWNFRLIYRLWNLSLQLAVNNALQYHYTEVERNMAEIRNFVVSVSGEF